MKYAQLLNLVGDEPLFETAMMAEQEPSPYHAQRRLVDWTKTGKVVPLRRGLYALPRPLRQVEPHPFVVANRLVPNSYISLEMALRHYNLIPEHVAVVTSVTTGRPGEWENEFGRFLYRHIHPRYFFGMTRQWVAEGQEAIVAHPEKALLDLIYLRKRGDDPDFIRSLRLQNLDALDVERLRAFAARFDKPKIYRAVHVIEELAEAEMREYEWL
jgi:predicted transcriptional regulator of viral defense system